jgi:predicted translin family RNA/ssDNA-binding protein
MSETTKQIENISEETKQQTDTWMESMFQEFDWISRNKQKISDALKEIQEKLRPYEDEYRSLVENHQKDNVRALELKEKITLLHGKLKDVYKIYKQ